MISFQFSPVKMMKTVTTASPVDEKLYLEMEPSSFFNGSWKNCLLGKERRYEYEQANQHTQVGNSR